MADITVTTARVGLVDPIKSVCFNGIASVAISAGQAVYIDPTSGKLALADGSVAATANGRGIAINSVGAGQAVTCVKEGPIYGFDLSALDYDTHVHISDTAGALGSAASDATVDVICGRVIGLTDSDMSKVLYVDFDWNTEQS